MERTEATRRLEELLERVVAGAGEWIPSVSEVSVFGSYARGALRVRDIDVSIELDQDHELGMRMYALMTGGSHAHAGFNRELRGRQRSLEMHYDQKAGLPELGPLVTLWRRGDSLELALGRLHAIAPDASAGAAVREWVLLPGFEDVTRRILRPDRRRIAELVEKGEIAVVRVDLPDALPAVDLTRRRIEARWAEGNPSRRAVLAAAAWLEAVEAVGPLEHARVDVMVSAAGDVAVAIGGKTLGHGVDFVLRLGGRLWLAVVNPSRAKPLVGFLLKRNSPPEARDGPGMGQP